MPDDNAKKYCVIDHTAKSSDQRRKNPNRLAKQREAERWLAALEDVLADEDARMARRNGKIRET